MKIYRIVKEQYKHDLTGEGARLYGGRWNNKGESMLYFSEHLSLCALEIIVHLENQFVQNDFYYIEAEIPDNDIYKLKDANKKILGWNAITLNAATQQYGSSWIKKDKHLALSVPSVIVPQERNILINPRHNSMGNLKVVKVAPFIIDPRVH